MPTYEYRCKDCSNELEVQQAFSDEALTECPSCGGTLKKKFGAVGISFKGSGFYKTDSRGSSAAGTVPANSSTSSGDSSSAAAAAGSSDSPAPASTATAASTPSPAAPAST